jgi:hypothetical protein
MGVAENSARQWHAVADVVTQRVSATAGGKLAGIALGTASQIKFYYDTATYAGSLIACMVQ